MAAQLIALVLLFEEVITYSLHFRLALAGGGVTLFALLSFLLAGRPNLKFNIFALFWAMYILVIASLPITAEFSVRTVTGIILLILTLLVSMSDIRINLGRSRVFFWSLLLILILVLFSRINLSAFSLISGFSPSEPVALYSEPSHLVLYSSIIYLYSIKSRPRDLVQSSVIFLAILFLNLGISAILMSIIPLISIFQSQHQSRYTKYIIILSIILLVSIFLPSKIDLILAKNPFVESANPTALFISSNYLIIRRLFADMPSAIFAGYGLGGLQAAYQFFLPDLPFELRSGDGAFLYSRLVVELGFLVSSILTFLLLRILVCSRDYLAIIPLASYLFLRGWGYSPAILLTILLLSKVPHTVDKPEQGRCP
jgi:hypothetical protein